MITRARFGMSELIQIRVIKYDANYDPDGLSK